MQGRDLKAMSSEQLWDLHEKLVAELGRKIRIEKATLEDRLRKIGPDALDTKMDRRRRPYPKVPPKYRNPRNPSQTWAGRGKQPQWIKEQLRSGKKLDALLIRRSSTNNS
jgi:DNA-binding protein H-NS